MVHCFQLFRAMHNAYIAHLANPFTAAEMHDTSALQEPIRSVKFERNMDEIAGLESASRPTLPPGI